MTRPSQNQQLLCEGVKSKYIFSKPCTEVSGNDIFFCSCGQVNEKPLDSNFEIDISYEDYLKLDFLDLSKISKRTKFICPHCASDYSRPEVYNLIKNLEQKFLERFDLEEDDKELILYKYKFWGAESEGRLEVLCDYTAISISKSQENCRLRFKPYGKEEFDEMDLHQIVDSVNLFFTADHEVEMGENFISVHDFIGRMSRFVSDADNIDIVKELLGEIGFSTGIGVLKKIISSFLGIIAYSNLSTIAMTKGPKFLFEMMENCPLPTSQYMKESGATSPIKIFNYLVSLKNRQIQKQLDSDDTNKLGYKYVNEHGREFNIVYDSKRYDDNDGRVAIQSKKIFVRDEIVDRQISPFIFNKITKFSDYENLIRYLRFVSYDQLIDLCMKYDKDFLIEVYKLIEFRDEVDYERVLQFICLVEDFCRTTDINKEGSTTASIVSKYDFNIYDDCQRMLTELQWDFNKVFHKIRKHGKLLQFHDDLVKHRSYLNDAEINSKYAEFSNKFTYLENYKGAIRVKVINLPEELVEKAKEMKNCAASYVRRVALGEYIAFMVYDNNPDRVQGEFYEYMMVLELGKYGLEFVGVKGPCNIYGPDRFKRDVIKFLEDNDISYKEVPSIRLGIGNKD